MHRVWDSGIIERAEGTEEFWLAALAQLDTTENRAGWWMKGTVEEWGDGITAGGRHAQRIRTR
jgi:hypothetical protein